ncbi:MAG: bifunctional aspartate kinase/homoserine dehydrogenase I [Acidobacteriota bacterium]
MNVLKFGGTSVATADAIRRVRTIVRDARAKSPVVVVVSALGGATQALLDLASRAAARDEGWPNELDGLRLRHLETAAELVTGAGHDALEATLEARFADLHDLLRGVFLLRELSARASDGIVSYGERLAAEIVAAAFAEGGLAAVAVDARALIRTDDRFGGARVRLEPTLAALRAALEGRDDVPVVTGFVAATDDGRTTTLGRGGSDYTAALVGVALDARIVELWTDVAGIHTADPRRVPDARPIEAMSYAELMELSHFGAKVVFAPTLHPIRQRAIPLAIHNTFAPHAGGTRVTADGLPAKAAPVRAITSIPEVALLRLEGNGMQGVPGIAARLFAALARHEISVILISQASSEHSICFAVAPSDADAARRAVDAEFENERRLGVVEELQATEPQAALAVVGERMVDSPGLAGRLFDRLGREGISVTAIAQGSSERNISWTVAASDHDRALRSAHAAFFGSVERSRRANRRLDVILLGTGGVGGALLEQIAARQDALAEHEDLDLRLVAVAGSRRLLTDADGLDPTTARDDLAEAAASTPDRLQALLQPNGAARRVLVDCTAADGLEPLLERALRAGVGVVAANKKAFAGRSDAWSRLRDAASSAPLRIEATVGAGLPVLSTLEDLVRTGDVLRSIDAVLSGTIAVVLDRLRPNLPFSTAVRAAYDEGLTEPNPVDDLSGTDVARKLVILARQAGRTIEPQQVAVESLVPEGFANLSLDDLWPALASLDDAFEARRATAEAEGRRLRYVARLDADGARVRLEAVPPEHPAYGLAGPENMVAFRTDRYDPVPLTVRGPGAGRHVTAAGVFADLLAIARD